MPINTIAIITKVCCEAVRSAILATAWLLVSCVSVFLQFNNSELRDLYVHGIVDSWILWCVNRPDVAVCHTYH